MASDRITARYELAREHYAELGVDTDAALDRLGDVPISLHCWQGDDVGGFENVGRGARRRPGGHRQLSGQGADRRRAAGRLRQALSLIPGTHRLNLHASYAETGGRRVERDELAPEHFAGWIDWAKERASGWTSTPPTSRTRRRRTASRWPTPTPAIRGSGSTTGSPAGGSARRSARRSEVRASPTSGSPTATKDTPVDRKARASGWPQSLDEIFAEPDRPDAQPRRRRGQAVRPRLESYVVGSHEFYLGYAISRQKLLCLDAGHFHPTEAIADKISAVLLCAARDPAARQPRRALGQRPRRDPHRRAAGDRARSSSAAITSTASTSGSTSSTPASTASPPG